MVVTVHHVRGQASSHSDFGLFWQVTQGVPNSLYKVASTFDTYVYSALQSSTPPSGKTAAVSTFQSVRLLHRPS